MSKKFLPSFLGLSVLLVGWYFWTSMPVNRNLSNKIEVIVRKGESVDQVIKNLYEKKLIRSRVATKINIVFRGLSKKIQAGYFYLSPSESLNTITLKLTSSNTKQIWVTFPEGIRREEMAQILLEKFSEEGPQINFNPQDFIQKTTGLEGYLFPDTYAFDPDANTEDIIKRLNQEFEKNAESLGISPEQKEIIILASLLERESRQPEEMPLIAGIILKRIASSWPLQIDATVQYAISSNRCSQLNCDWWPSSLTPTDLKINSLYNSYLNQGLPPTPICNPGYNSLKSAINPKASDYWFYLHGPDGKIHFARTTKEHQQNICSYLNKNC